jgi:uncharacterized protein (TIGR02266 family)
VEPRRYQDRDLAKFFRVPLLMPVDYDGRELLLQSRIANISQHGVFISTPKPLAVGTPLELRFQVPGERELMVCKGVVRWSRGSPQATRPVSGKSLGMGVEFVGLTRKQHKVLADFIARFIAEMRARKHA